MSAPHEDPARTAPAGPTNYRFKTGVSVVYDSPEDKLAADSEAEELRKLGLPPAVSGPGTFVEIERGRVVRSYKLVNGIWFAHDGKNDWASADSLPAERYFIESSVGGKLLPAITGELGTATAGEPVKRDKPVTGDVGTAAAGYIGPAGENWRFNYGEGLHATPGPYTPRTSEKGDLGL